jgi:hypothetical protein
MTVTAHGRHTRKALRTHAAQAPRERRGLHMPGWLRRRTTADAIAEALSQPLPAPVAAEFTGASFEDSAPWRDAAEPEGPETPRSDAPAPDDTTMADPGLAAGPTGAPSLDAPEATSDPEPAPALWLRMLDTQDRPMDRDVLLIGGPLTRVAPMGGGVIGAVNLGECPWGSVEVAGPSAALRRAADALTEAAGKADRAAGILAEAEAPVPADVDAGAEETAPAGGGEPAVPAAEAEAAPAAGDETASEPEPEPAGAVDGTGEEAAPAGPAEAVTEDETVPGPAAGVLADTGTEQTEQTEMARQSEMAAVSGKGGTEQ